MISIIILKRNKIKMIKDSDKYIKILKSFPFESEGFIIKSDLIFFERFQSQLAEECISYLNKGQCLNIEQSNLLIDLFKFYINKKNENKNKLKTRVVRIGNRTVSYFFEILLSEVKNDKLNRFFTENNSIFKDLLFIMPVKINKINLSTSQLLKIIKIIKIESCDIDYSSVDTCFFDYLNDIELNYSIIKIIKKNELINLACPEMTKDMYDFTIYFWISFLKDRSLQRGDKIEVEIGKSILNMKIENSKDIKICYDSMNYIKNIFNVKKIEIEEKNLSFKLNKDIDEDFILKVDSNILRETDKRISHKNSLMRKVKRIISNICFRIRKDEIFIKNEKSINYLKIFNLSGFYDLDIYIKIEDFLFDNKEYYNESEKTITNEGLEILMLNNLS